MYTVVVADDEEELRRALIRKVDWESIGFSVVGEAENGAEALELVEKYEPDLLLTDIRMPFVSGIELARQVREVRPATQIAFLSGFDDFTYAQQAIQYNIVSYMLKPISAAELTEELKKIRKKIDEKFQKFASSGESTETKEIKEFLVPLLLDGFYRGQEEEKEQKLLEEALACGLIKNPDNNFSYTVMIVSIIDEAGNNQTAKANVNAVDFILKKYVKHASFYMDGRVVSFLMASLAGFEKYLHIIVEEIAQSVKRIMGCSGRIGVSRPVERLSDANEAYIEAMNVIRYSWQNGSNVHFMADLLSEQRKKSSTLLCDKALEIIEKKYMNQELSLVSVSSEIAVSPNYLSALIKKETGSTFVDLLSRKRIEVAKNLLQYSDMKVKEISEKCGYNDQHYFSYCFKKYTGMSPNACRRKTVE